MTTYIDIYMFNWVGSTTWLRSRLGSTKPSQRSHLKQAIEQVIALLGHHADTLKLKDIIKATGLTLAPLTFPWKRVLARVCPGGRAMPP